MSPHATFRDDDDEDDTDQDANIDPDDAERDSNPTDPEDIIGQRSPHSRFEAHPVIAPEVSRTEITDEYPTTTPENDSAEKAILPTGGVVGRVQYIGEVTHKSSGITDDGAEFAEVTMEGGGETVSAIGYNVPRSDYRYLCELNPPQYIRVTGWISVDEHGDSQIIVENTHPVSIRSWINHTTTAAEAAFTRANALQNYKSTNPNLEAGWTHQSASVQTIHGFREALIHYGYDHQTWCSRIREILKSVSRSYTTHINADF